MATNNSINLNQVGLCKYDGAGTFSATTVTQYNAIVGGSSNALTSVAMSAGTVLIGTTASNPAAATITGSLGVTVSATSGAINISGVTGGYTWTDSTGLTQALAVQNGYIANSSGGLLVMTLPSSSAAIGDTILIMGKGSSGWKIAQNALQQIIIGSATPSTVGVTGNISSTNAYDTVRLVCITAGTSSIWSAIVTGNITIV